MGAEVTARRIPNITDQLANRHVLTDAYVGDAREMGVTD